MMRELLIIVRREKSCDVKNLLSGMGLIYVSKTVKGRGKEGGIGYKTKRGLLMSLLPKTLITTWVEDDLYEEVIKKVIECAHTGFYGDGKIFVVGGLT
jgi:nitrogen regulatory protein PII